MNYQVNIQPIPDTRVISIRYTGQYKEIGDYFDLLFDLAKERVDGAPFALYYDESYNSEEADIEVCLPVSEEIGVVEPFHNKIIAGNDFATTIHTGSYKQLNAGYQAIEAYLNERELPIGIPSREIYLIGFHPSKNQIVEEFVTQIAIPLPRDEDEF